MIEAGQGASSFNPQGFSDGITAGMLLRHARETAGLHVATLAVALKVPVRKLEALETDRYDELPDAVFIRALASSVCRNLKIDPAPVLQRLPPTGAPRLAPNGGGINAPFRSPRDGAGPSWLDPLSRPVFLAVFALLLGALVLILLPSRRDDMAGGLALTPAPEVAALPPTTAAAPAAQGAIAAPEGLPASPGAAPAELAVPMAPLAISPALTSAARATPSPASPGTVVAAAPAAADAAAASQILVFRARGASWIEVTDAKGGVALRKLLAAGESAAASGALPLAVTVGSASTTEVEVRGKPLDLKPLARDNVARFEVK